MPKLFIYSLPDFILIVAFHYHTGIKNVHVNGGLPEEVLLQVPNMIKDIPIHALSDDDFSKVTYILTFHLNFAFFQKSN